MKTRNLLCIFAVVFLFVMTTTNANEERVAFDAINQFRASHGLHQLQWSEELANASREWSRTMRERRFFDHAPRNIRNGAGENIAKGSTDGLGAFRQWRNSPPHRAYLLSPNSVEAGVGRDDIFWTYRARSSQAMEYASQRSTQRSTMTYSGDAQYRTVSEQKVQQTRQQPRKPVRNALKRVFRGR